jgi:glycosyltransferase involved in cell wall biosynthesis
MGLLDQGVQYMEKGLTMLSEVARGICLSPNWFVRPLNTDWLHTKYLAEALSGGEYGVTLDLDRRLHAIALHNAGYLSRHVRGRIGGPGSTFTPYRRYGINSSGYDFIYAYGTFPQRAGGTKILWHDGPSDVELLRGRGLTDLQIAEALKAKTEIAQAADRIAMSSEHSKRTFCEQFDVDHEKVDVLPFILPYTEALDDEAIVAKHQAECIHILFVGRAARRKGLDLLVEAYSNIKRLGVDARLTIVSEMQDGAVNLPDDPSIALISGASPVEVQVLMRTAHIFAMPSREESYGIVYIEALAAGAVPMAPDKPQQRLLLRGGDIGALVDGSVDDILTKLQELVFDRDLRLRKSLLGVDVFRKSYSRSAVLQQYACSFQKTMAS